MLDGMSVDEMINTFIKNGMDISYFKFLSDHDKKNFFMMYTEFFESMMKEDDEYSFRSTEDEDLYVVHGDEEIFFYITDSYQTLRCRLGSDYYDPTNVSQVLILSILFLSIKELKAIVDSLSKTMIDRYGDNVRTRASKALQELPDSFVGKANYLSSMQESIMESIEESRNKILIREIDI